MVTPEGRVIYKVNQDRGLISHPSLNRARHTIFGVFDGKLGLFEEDFSPSDRGKNACRGEAGLGEMSNFIPMEIRIEGLRVLLFGLGVVF